MSSAIEATVYSSYNATTFARLLENDGDPPNVAVRAEHSLLPGHAFAGGALPSPAGDVAIVMTTADGVLASIAAQSAGAPLDAARLEEDVDRVRDSLARLARDVRVALIATWPVPYRQSGGLLALDPAWGGDAAIARANARLTAALREIPNCHPLNADAWQRTLGVKSFGAKNWFLTKDPFSFEYHGLAVADVKAALNAIAGRSKKLLILDLDNTLWGGEVGDGGLDGLRLGGHDAIGEAYVAFQHAVAALARRGVVLAIASKNDERTALAVLDEHPEMVLRRGDFAGWRINWDEKAANIGALCSELELSPGDAVFIDDNPGERERVAAELPALTVPQWPGNPMLFGDALARLNVFDVPAVTTEDLGRGRSYAARRERERDAEPIEVRIDVRALQPGDHVRALQLLNKTNQMNLRTRRLGDGELRRELAASDRGMWVVRVADRFADYGLTGLLILQFAGTSCVVTDFVMSCRVMSRGVEERMLARARDEAFRRGCERVVLTLIPTERNEPMRRFLRERSGLTTADGLAFSGDAAPTAEGQA